MHRSRWPLPPSLPSLRSVLASVARGSVRLPVPLALARPREMVPGPAVHQSARRVGRSLGRSSAAPCQITGDFRSAAVAALPSPLRELPPDWLTADSPTGHGSYSTRAVGLAWVRRGDRVQRPRPNGPPGCETGLRVRTALLRLAHPSGLILANISWTVRRTPFRYLASSLSRRRSASNSRMSSTLSIVCRRIVWSWSGCRASNS